MRRRRSSWTGSPLLNAIRAGAFRDSSAGYTSSQIQRGLFVLSECAPRISRGLSIPSLLCGVTVSASPLGEMSGVSVVKTTCSIARTSKQYIELIEYSRKTDSRLLEVVRGCAVRIRGQVRDYFVLIAPEIMQRVPCLRHDTCSPGSRPGLCLVCGKVA